MSAFSWSPARSRRSSSSRRRPRTQTTTTPSSTPTIRSLRMRASLSTQARPWLRCRRCSHPRHAVQSRRCRTVAAHPASRASTGVLARYREPRRSRRCVGAVAAHLLRERARRGSASRASRRSRLPRASPRFPPSERCAHRDHRDRGRPLVVPRASASPPRRPCRGAGGPSGSRPARARARARSPLRAVAASSVRNPAALRTSRASFRFRSLSSTIEDEWSRAYPPRHADPARARRGSSPRPRGRAAAARDRSPTSRSRRCAATSTPCSPRWRRSGRTSSSPTSACRRATPTRGSRPPSGCATTASRRRRRRAQPVRDPELRPRAAGGRQRGALVPPEGARPGRRSSSCRRSAPSRRAAR